MLVLIILSIVIIAIIGFILVRNYIRQINEIKRINTIKHTKLQLEETQEENQTQNEQTYKEMSPVRLVMRRVFRSKLSIVGIIMIVALFLFSFLGPVVYTKWGEEEVDRKEVSEEIVTVHVVKDKETNEECYDLPSSYLNWHCIIIR